MAEMIRMVLACAMACALLSSSAWAQQVSPTERAKVLIAQLHDSDPTRRGSAKLELMARPSPDILQVLLEALNDNDRSVRRAVVEVLAVYQDRRKIPALIKLATEDRSMEIERQFTDLGAPAAVALIESISCRGTGDAGYASWAAAIVGDMGDPGRAALFAGLRSDDECRWQAAQEGLFRPYMRPATASAAEEDERIEEAHLLVLATSVRHRDPVVRQAAERWIDAALSADIMSMNYASFVEVLVRTYQSASISSRRAIAELLSTVDTPRVLRFMRAAVNSPDSQVVRIARAYVGRATPAPPRTSPPAGTRLPRTPAERKALAKVLGESDETDNTSQLIRLLDDVDASVRKAAATGLGTLNAAPDPMNAHRDSREPDTENSVAALLRHLTDRSPAVRAAVAKSVGQILTPSLWLEFEADEDQTSAGAVTARRIAPLLRDPDTTVVVSAIEALGLLRSRSMIPRLVPLTLHQDAKIRAAATSALSALSGKHTAGATCPLLVRMQDTDATVRYEAAKAIEHAFESGERCEGDVDVLLATFKDRDLRRFLYAPLALLKDPRAVPVLLQDLDEPGQSCVACWTLGRIGDLRAVEPLVRLLDRADAEFVISVLEALARLQDARSLGAAVKALRSQAPGVRLAALRAIDALGPCGVIADLRPSLTDESQDVRLAAAKIAASCKVPRGYFPTSLIVRMTG